MQSVVQCSVRYSVGMIRRTVKAVLVDLSGTLHVEDLLLPGAVEGIRRCVAIIDVLNPSLVVINYAF